MSVYNTHPEGIAHMVIHSNGLKVFGEGKGKSKAPQRIPSNLVEVAFGR